MADNTMPVAEVQADVSTDEVVHYECAFHILPTVTEEEVPGVVDAIKSHIMRAGGALTAEEAAEQIDLAYEITTQVEGSNRRFSAAYFGWVRFTLAPEHVNALNEEIKHMPEVLRYLIVKLTKTETEQPFYFFATRRDREEAIAAASTDGEEVTGPTEDDAGVEAANASSEPAADKTGNLDDSLEKITKE